MYFSYLVFSPYLSTESMYFFKSVVNNKLNFTFFWYFLQFWTNLCFSKTHNTMLFLLLAEVLLKFWNFNFTWPRYENLASFTDPKNPKSRKYQEIPTYKYWIFRPKNLKSLKNFPKQNLKNWNFWVLFGLEFLGISLEFFAVIPFFFHQNT